jgi:hypothetical protein
VALPSCQQIGGDGRAGVWPCPKVRVGAGSRADRRAAPPPMPAGDAGSCPRRMARGVIAGPAQAWGVRLATASGLGATGAMAAAQSAAASRHAGRLGGRPGRRV